MANNEFDVTFDINGDESGLRRSLERARSSVQDFSRQFNQAIANPVTFAPFIVSLRDAGRQFSQLTSAGTGTFRAISISAGSAAGNIISLKKDIDGLKGSFAQFTVTAIAAGVQASKGVSFETAFSDVRKVVDGTQDELKQLENDIKSLSTRISLPLSGLTDIVAKGGQIGIPIDELTQFAELVAKTSVGFELLPEEAGRAMGSLRAIFNLTIPELERLGDQINVVADKAKGVVEERDLLNLVTRIGDVGQQFGLLRSETLALSGAILSLGKPPDVAATALQNLLTSLRTAELQTDDFQNALKAIGIDAKVLAKNIDENPKKALDGFLDTLKSLDARSRAGVINQLFGKGEDAVVINQLISSLEEYRKLVKLASQEELFSGSLARTFEEREKTVSAAVQRMKNAFNVLSINVSEIFLPTIRFAADVLNDLATALANVAQDFPNLSAFARITALILPLAGAFRLLGVGIRLITAAIGPAITTLRGLIAAAAGGGVFAVLSASLEGVVGVLSAAFRGVFGRLILGIGLVTGAFSGLTAAASGFGAVLVAIATNPFVLFIGGITAMALRIAGAGSIIARFGAAIAILGRGLLALVGGPIGLAVTALAFLGVKFLEIKDRVVDFAGEQATVTEIIAAAWRVLTNPIADFASNVSKSLSGITADMLSFVGINQQTANAIKRVLSDAGQLFNNFARDAANGIIRGFQIMSSSVAIILGGMIRNIRSNLSSAADIARAAARDIKNAFSGDFGISNFSKAIADSSKKNAQNFSSIKNDLKKSITEIGKTDYVGALVDGAKRGIKKAGDVFKTSVAEEIRKGRKVAVQTLGEEQRKAGLGKAIDFAAVDPKAGGGGLGASKSGRTALDTARDDAKQITQATLQELQDGINQQQSLLQSSRDLELQKAGDNAQAKLAIERKFNEDSLALKLQLLNAELSVKQQELAASGDRGDAALILADIKRLEGEVAAARQQSGNEAQKLAITEQASAAERLRTQTQLRDQLLQGTGIGEAEAQLKAEAEVFDAFKNGILQSQQEFTQALDAVRNRFKESTDGISIFADQAARNMQSAFADFLFDPFSKGINGMLLDFVNILKRMAAEALSAQVFEAILGKQGKDGIRSEGLLSGILNSLSGQSQGGQGQKTQEAASAAPNLLGGFFSGIGDLFKNGMNSVLSGLSSAGGGIASFFSGFGSLISDGLSALGGLFSSGGSGGGSSAGGIASIITSLASLFVRDGGYIQGYAQGGSPGLASGKISGPGTGTSDSINAILPIGSFILKAASARKIGSDYLAHLSQSIEPARVAARAIHARVSNDEWFFDPATVNAVGRGFLQHLNDFGAPPPMPQSTLAFAAGGLVNQGGGKSSSNSGTGNQNSGNVRIINVIDPAMAKNWFESSAGEKIVLNHIRRNESKIFKR